jgi:predicted nucleic acid-binding protein
VAGKYFLDSNVLLYTIDDDVKRTPVAKSLVTAGAVISVQVLNEFTNIASKKFRLQPSEIDEALDPFRTICKIVPVAFETHERAFEIFTATNLGIYDACIVAAAELAGCDTLYTEDLNDGQRIGRVTIRNPFMVE